MMVNTFMAFQPCMNGIFELNERTATCSNFRTIMKFAIVSTKSVNPEIGTSITINNAYNITTAPAKMHMAKIVIPTIFEVAIA
jgi:hypothetical protein